MTPVPGSELHIITPRPTLSVLYIAGSAIRIESDRPMPNPWIRFWHRFLLGWRWEKA